MHSYRSCLHHCDGSHKNICLCVVAVICLCDSLNNSQQYVTINFAGVWPQIFIKVNTGLHVGPYLQAYKHVLLFMASVIAPGLLGKQHLMVWFFVT